MTGASRVTVLRLGHRPGRDDRVTTHVGLTARALGATRIILPDDAGGAAETIRDVTDRFGGPFTTETTANPLGVLRGWSGDIVHLTMYGEPVQTVINQVRATHKRPLLVVVGAEKIPREVFDHADWNVAVTNQPHSEIAAIAVFLDHLFEGNELDREWDDADHRVVPDPRGKTLDPPE